MKTSDGWPPIGSRWEKDGRTRVVSGHLHSPDLVIYRTWSSRTPYHRLRQQVSIESWRRWVLGAQQMEASDAAKD